MSLTLGRNLAYYLFGTMGASGLGFVTAVYLTSILSPDSYGFLGVFVLLIYVVEPIICFCGAGLMEILYVKKCARDYAEWRANYAGLILINGSLCFLFSLLVSVYFTEFWLLLVFVPVFAVVRNFHKLCQLEFVQDGRAKEGAVLIFSSSLLAFGLTVFFSKVADFGWSDRLSVMLIAEMSLLLLLFSLSRIKMDVSFPNRAKLSEFFLFGLPIFIGVGGAWVLHESDKVVVVKFLSLSDMGIYAFAYTVGRSVDLITTSYIKAMRPVIYQKLNGVGVCFNWLVFHLTLLLLVLGGVSAGLYSILALFGDDWIGEEYLAGSGVVIWIMVAFIFFGGYRLCSLVLEFHKKNFLKMILFYFGAVVNIGFSIGLVGPLGLLGPAIATAFGFFSIFLVSLIYISKNKKRLLVNV